MTNIDWSEMFSSFSLEVLVARNSDHVPICLSIRQEMKEGRRRKRAFDMKLVGRRIRVAKKL